MEIQEIKTRLSIETVLQRYNLTPDKHHKINCPFHEDKSPSLVIYPQTNTFNCFGCGATGDQIQFIELYEKCTKHEALIKATEMVSPGQPVKPEPNLTELYEGFKQSFTRNPKAQEYAQSRNLTISEIGYNPGKDYNKLKTCIVFPLRNKAGQITSLYGRSITNNDNAKHYYTANRKGLFPGYPKPETTKLILTEAIIDTATLLQIPEIITEYELLTCYGTNGLTNEHIQAIKELQNLEEIIFFFDGDKAGREGTAHNAETLHQLLPNVKISQVDTSEGEDINSLLQGHEPEIFTHLIENRKNLFLLIELSEAISRPERVTSSNKKESIQEPVRTTGKLNTRNPEFITFTSDNLQIVLLGGINLEQLDRLRITIKISRTDTGDPLHSIRHTLDLYHSDYLEKFINKASEQLEISTNLIKRTMAELTEQIEQYRLSKIESIKEQKPQVRQLTEERKNRAIRYLKAPDLLQRTNEDIGKTGVIGEKTNRLLMYLVFTSRLRELPLHIVSLGASGTGKTYLQEKVSELIPEQDKLEITILTENAFYYFDRKELKHKLVLIEDMDGAQEVLYPLRELQTKRHISKTVPIKDSKGNLRTITLHVEGPICLAGTTTKEKLYEDNANRSLLIYLDNSPEHKELIMEYQRKFSAGKINTRQETELKEFFKDMQSILKPIKVRNPFAEYLKLPEHVFKPLRTNAHYLAFIETITFYHQYQREIKTDPTGEQYIETNIEDIEWANKLLKDVLLAKSDELTNAERSFFESLKQWLKANNKTSFYTKEIRDVFRMHPSKVKRYLYGLTTYNMVKITGGNRFKNGFEYEVVTLDDYSKLECFVNTVLDNVLNEIKQKVSGSGGLPVVYGQNRPLNHKENNKLMAVVQ
jgi:DNA primase